MSVLGAGVAAGVAQTGLQAQQTARTQDRKKAQDAEAARRLRERFEAHLHAAEDVDKVELVEAAQLDGHVPRDQNHTDEPVTHAETSEDTHTVERLAAQADQPDDEGVLYHHLDVTG